MPRSTSCLGFGNNVEEAMDLYTSLFDDAKVIHVIRDSEGGPVRWANFEIAGLRAAAQ